MVSTDHKNTKGTFPTNLCTDFSLTIQQSGRFLSDKTCSFWNGYEILFSGLLELNL